MKFTGVNFFWNTVYFV